MIFFPLSQHDVLDSYHDLLALILLYFAVILPFHFLLFLGLQPFFLFLTPSFFSFPLFSLPLVIFSLPNDKLILPPKTEPPEDFCVWPRAGAKTLLRPRPQPTVSAPPPQHWQNKFRVGKNTTWGHVPETGHGPGDPVDGRLSHLVCYFVYFLVNIRNIPDHVCPPEKGNKPDVSKTFISGKCVCLHGEREIYQRDFLFFICFKFF
jgi:hypothetical protein